MLATLITLVLNAAIETDVASPEKALETVVDSIQQTIPAKQTSRAAPKYPGTQLRRGREAWVHVTYCIDESGDIQNVSVLDSIGNDAFDRAAIKTVQQWKFDPAMQDGQPAWQSRNEVFVLFAIEGGELGASADFIRRHRKIGELIENQKLQEADKLFWDVYENFSLSLYELGKLWALRVRYEALIGDLYRVDMALHRATASHGTYIDKKSYIQLLSLHAQVQLGLGKYYEALHSFNDLVDVTSEDAEEVLALKPTFEKVRALIDDDKPWSIKAEVRQRGDCAFCNDSWEFTPLRNDFTFDNVEGTLKSIDMRCDHKRFETAVSELVEWHIPEKWGQCHIQVYGEPGTKFDVVMLPAS